MQKSPGGSTYPYYYKGGEIHALKYGGFGKEEARLLALIPKEEEFILNTHAHLRVWVDFYDTVITDSVLQAFAESMVRLQPQILRLAPVGLSSRDRRRLTQALRAIPMPVRYFSDPEDAKTWLVSEAVK